METILFFLIVTSFLWIPFGFVVSVFFVAFVVEIIETIKTVRYLFYSKEDNHGHNN